MNKNGVKLLAAVAVFAMMFAGMAVVLSDNGDVDAASGDTTYISGTITAGTEGSVNDQNYKSGSKVVINGDLTIPKYAKLTIEGASLTINEGVTVTIEAGGQLEIKAQNTTQPTVKVNGKIVAKGIVDSTPAIINSVADSTDGKTGVFVYGNITLSEGAVMAAKGVDATVAEEGSAPNGDIVVLAGGSIDITKKNSNVSKMTDQTVYIAEGVTFTMTGFAENVTVTAYTGSDKFYQTSKVVINKTAGNTDTKKVSSIVIKTVVEKNQAKYGTSVDQGQPEYKDKVTMKNYVMDVSGDLKNNDAISIEKGVSKYTSSNTEETVGTNTVDEATGLYYLLDSKGNAVASKPVMPSATVSGKLTVDELGKMTVDVNTKLVISGDLSVAYDEKNEKSKDRIALNGEVVIEGTASVNWNAMKENGSPTGKLIMDGGLLTIVGFEDTNTTTTAKVCVGGFYGAYYTVEDVAKSTSTTYFSDLKAAIEGAAAADVDEVVVYAGKESQNAANSENALKAGAYVVADGTVVPAGMTLTVMNAIYIPKDATMTFEADSVFDMSDWGQKHIFVDGKLVDNGEVIYGTDSTQDAVYYQVSKYNEDTDVAVFTTLKIALSEAVSGEVIKLNVKVNIESDMTIPQGVTVETAENETVNGVTTSAIAIAKDKTLTIDGTLYLPENATVTVGEGKIVLNGDIVSVGNIDDYAGSIAGAYYQYIYDETEDLNYISSAELAAERSSEIDEAIAFNGKISAGDLTFTKGEESDSLVVTINDEFKAKTITLKGADLEVIGETTADVVVDVTAGQTTISLSKAKNVFIDSVVSDDGETITTTATIGSYYKEGDMQQVYGNVTVQNGEVSVVKETKFYSGEGEIPAAKLSVAKNAKLVIAADVTLADSSKTEDLNASKIDVEKYISDKATFVVDGTVDVKENGVLNWGVSDINGQLNILKGGEMNLTIAKIDGIVDINKDVSSEIASIEVAFVYGTVNGDMTIGNIAENISGFLLAYPGSNITLYTDDDGTFTGEKTAVYLNGELFFTAYSASNASGEAIKLAKLMNFVYLNGFDKSKSEYFSDAALTETVDLKDQVIGEPEALYVEMPPMDAKITVSVGSGISLYIDGVKYDASKTTYTVGEHSVEATVNPGYKGDVTITFNGQTVTDGKIVITSDMIGKNVVLSATGNISVDYGTSDSTSSDDGMGITDYLLIVLVVLAAILVVIVALRMMRS